MINILGYDKSENEDEKNKNLNGTCGAFNAYEPIDGCSADECNMAVGE